MPAVSTDQVPSVVAEAFDSRVRQRGFDYAFSRLSQLHLDDRHACAEVLGDSGRTYEAGANVISTPAGSALIVECTCPVGAGLEPCKHVWALLVRASAERPNQWCAPADLAPGVVSHADFQFEIHPAGVEGDQWWVLEETMERFALAGARVDDPVRRWRAAVASTTGGARLDRLPAPVRSSKRPVLEYVLDAGSGSELETELHVRVFQRSPTKTGLGKPRRFAADADALRDLQDPVDRAACSELFGSGPADAASSYGYRSWSAREVGAAVIGPSSFVQLLPRLCATGRFGHAPAAVGSRRRYDELMPLRWDGDLPYAATLELSRAGTGWQPRLSLAREGDAIAAEDVQILCRDLGIADDRLIRFERGTAAAAWLAVFDDWEDVRLADADLSALVDRLANQPAAPRLAFDDGAPWTVASAQMQPRLRFSTPSGRAARVRGDLDFVYGDGVADGTTSDLLLADAGKGLVTRRDLAAERAAVAALDALPIAVHAKATVAVDAADFATVVRRVLELGWRVEADGKLVRRASSSSVRVTTGIDWFDVNVAAVFDGDSVALPALLAAARSGSEFVQLGDGTTGMLPESWLAKFGALVASGEAAGDVLRFSHNQTALLDALLATAPQADVDAQFARARDKLREINGIEPAGEPEGFVGELRAYQREGLGWLRWLKDAGLGGCLADDMGLGKTIQVLALLAVTRACAGGPALVVAPRSLTHNWIDEAARFAPDLIVVDYSGSGRKALQEQFARADLIVTTYGIVRRDIVDLAAMQFDTVVLDEAQAIKNPSSQANKACRSLRANHRLALTGTPVENSIDDLFAIVEFINPGLLAGSRWRKLLGAAGDSGDYPAILARALRPFLLRRTKQQVLDDLPDKIEQVIYCEMDRDQRRIYDELRGHYQRVLTQRVETEGMAKSKFQVLEALLRLRQAACHPGLIDKQRRSASSAKLDALLDRVVELARVGEKVLVFSQFTSLLALARARLGEAGIVYEYLDGRTRKRAARVQRFQDDAECTAFLISLKAGGHGLNLTAANYVFLLDPWWNPAVEAQAIDRAHRIGQSRTVFAYRLIAEDTVEDKILELQQHKRELADGIFRQDEGVLASLSSEELSRLLS